MMETLELVRPGVLRACRELNEARRRLGVKPLDVATIARWPGKVLLRFLVDYSGRACEMERRGPAWRFYERLRCDGCGRLRGLDFKHCRCGGEAAGQIVAGFVLAADVAALATLNGGHP